MLAAPIANCAFGAVFFLAPNDIHSSSPGWYGRPQRARRSIKFVQELSGSIEFALSHAWLRTEVGQWMRQIGSYDLLPNANLWRKARGIQRIRLSGVA